MVLLAHGPHDQRRSLARGNPDLKQPPVFMPEIPHHGQTARERPLWKRIPQQEGTEIRVVSMGATQIHHKFSRKSNYEVRERERKREDEEEMESERKRACNGYAKKKKKRRGERVCVLEE